MSCRQAPRLFFQGAGERMFEELTALAPFTMKFMIHQSESSTWYGLEIPDGNVHSVDGERFRRVDILFQSSFFGKGATRLHDTSFKYNVMSDADIRKDLYAMSCCLVARPWSK